MKKWCLFLSVYMLLCLMAGCSAAPEGIAPDKSSLPSSSQPETDSTLCCRVITGAEDGVVLLCGTGEDQGLYRLSLEGKELRRDGKKTEDTVQNGDLITVGYDGTIMETWPAAFSGVKWIDIRNGGTDNRSELYLRVLEDLWKADSGLNTGIDMMGLDLSETSLTPAERTGVAWAFGEAHGLEVLEATWTQLCEEGYIDLENLVWENGCYFSVSEKVMEGTFSLQTVCFDAQKWRSGLGAYFFTDCTSVRSALGVWGEYAIGSEMIA